MPQTTIETIQRGEYRLAREEEPGAPVMVLVAEDLGADVAVSFCNTQTRVVALARQVEAGSLPAILSQLGEHAVMPPHIAVSFIGGAGQRNSPAGSRVEQYVVEVLEALRTHAGSHVPPLHLASRDPSLPKIKIEGERYTFDIMQCEVLDRPHPESIYLVARSQQPDVYTPHIKERFTSLAAPLASPLPASALAPPAATPLVSLSRKHARDKTKSSVSTEEDPNRKRSKSSEGEDGASEPDVEEGEDTPSLSS